MDLLGSDVGRARTAWCSWTWWTPWTDGTNMLFLWWWVHYSPNDNPQSSLSFLSLPLRVLLACLD